MNARNSQTELALERREEEKKRWRTLRNQNGKNVFRNKNASDQMTRVTKVRLDKYKILLNFK
jgi:hypothetical protein